MGLVIVIVIQVAFALAKLIICSVSVSATSASARLSQLTETVQLSLHPSDVRKASVDFGGLVRAPPAAVLRPRSAGDVARLLRAASADGGGFPVSARGHGHSVNGQAHAPGGVVVEMTHCPAAARWRRRPPAYSADAREHYVDAWGGELWIDVLNRTLQHGGLAPRSWTDYLYLSVGGTLSNAGISGQAFHRGPQISNVHELDVVTGDGETVTCSKTANSELFFAVLGGLGQFGIITRARIALEVAPRRVRWIRMLYEDFASFSGDQERLIGAHGDRRFDYVEGFVVATGGLASNWRSSFFSSLNPVKLGGFVHPPATPHADAGGGGLLYCLEVTRNYDDYTADAVEQEVEWMLRELSFVPSTAMSVDLPYVEFLDRVHAGEMKLRSRGLWEEAAHPWLNLFVPASRIADFDRAVLRRVGTAADRAGGPILIYPLNKHKWDSRSSAATPDEDVFYLVAFLRSAANGTGSPELLMEQNKEILEICDRRGIGIKQYLPQHNGESEWARHFGPRWPEFRRLKSKYDPKFILGSGQKIFSTAIAPATLKALSV